MTSQAITTDGVLDASSTPITASATTNPAASGTASATSTPTSTGTSSDVWNWATSKPLEAYLYPSIALIIFIFISIHVFRYVDRRRAIRRLRWEALHGPPRIFIPADAPKPDMYDVSLYRKARVLEAKDWEEIQPLSTTIVHTKPIAVTAASHRKTPKPPLSHRAKVAIRAILKTLGEEFSYLVFWRRQPSRMPDFSNPGVPPGQELVYTQHELVTGVVIAMPSERAAKSRRVDDEALLPEVMLGFREQGWV